MRKFQIIFITLITIMNIFTLSTFATTSDEALVSDENIVTSVSIGGMSLSIENPFYHNAVIDSETGNIITSAVVNNIEENANAKVTWNKDTGEAIINLYSLNVDAEDAGIDVSGNAEIVVTPETINTITSIGSGITCNESLIVSGSGKLEIVSDIESSSSTINAIMCNDSINITDTELVITGQTCISSPIISINNLELTLVGSKNGILAASDTKDVSVTFSNCTGSITGLAMTGVRVYGKQTNVDVLNCSLVVNGNQERTNKASYFCSGFYLSSNFDASVTMDIINCESIYASGGNGGIIMDNSSKENTHPVLLNIENSNVTTETNTVYWAAIFMNNFGLSETAATKVNIENNTIVANAPKDVGIMTATAGTKADSVVEIKNSTVDLDGVAAGIRVRASAGEQEDAIATVVNSVVSSPNSVGIDTQAKAESGSWIAGTVETEDGGLIIDKQTLGLTGVLHGEITLNKDITLSETAEWSSTDGAVMTVEAGVTVTFNNESGDNVVKFPAGGTISISDDGKFIYIINAERLLLSKDSISMKKGKQQTLIVTIFPENATSQLTWKSSNESVVTVDNNGIITPIAKGKATITVSESNSGLFATCNVTVTSSGTAVKARRIEIHDSEGGIVTSDKSQAKKGSIIELKITPDDGYKLENITVTALIGSEIEFTKIEENIYTFEMPASKVDVYAYFEKKICEGTPLDNCPSTYFEDLDTSMWYHLQVDDILNKKLMIGYDNGLFGTNDNITRAQIVTMLWRLENKPIVNYLMTYEDVDENYYYSEAIRWATSEKVVNGYNEYNFGPNDFITREQLATMIYRYEQLNGGGFVEMWAFRLNFEDINELNEYAYEAMCWCTMNEIVIGDENYFFKPKDLATRAQAAAIFSRYLNIVD